MQSYQCFVTIVFSCQSYLGYRLHLSAERKLGMPDCRPAEIIQLVTINEHQLAGANTQEALEGRNLLAFQPNAPFV